MSCRVTLEFGLVFKGLLSSFYFVFCQGIVKKEPVSLQALSWVSESQAQPEICNFLLPPHTYSGQGLEDLVRRSEKEWGCVLP